MSVKSTPPTVTFSAFTEPVTGNDAEILAGNLKLSSTASKQTATTLGFVIILGAIAFRNAYILIGLVGVGLLWLAGVFASRKRKRHEQIGVRLQKFSQDNSYSFTPTVTDLSLANPGTLFTDERKGAHTDFVVKGTIHSHPFWMGLYWFEAALGRESVMYRLPVIAITLPRAVPHVILDRMGNNQLTYRSGMRQLKLEGNFHDSFVVWCAPEYERDVLYFLTPELMQLLLDTDRRFDLEIIGDQLYIYGARKMEGLEIDPDVWQALFQTASSVGLELIENTRRYQDYRADPAVGTLAPSGIVQARGIPKVIVFITTYAFFAVVALMAVLWLFLSESL